nr:MULTISPECIES: YdcH family protein [Comamonas]
MFPEYREQIAHLRATDRHFSRLFEEHNLLDHEVQQLESKHSPAFQIEIDALKKQKLALKEQLYSLLRQEAADAP